MPTRFPAGTGWVDSSWATSNAVVRPGVRITPDCSKSVTTAASDNADELASRPGVTRECRPDFTAMTGLVLASTRASRANFRGLPNDSRYSSTTSVRSSPCQNCSRSLPETSARLPADTKVDSPRPAVAASARIAMPSAPDWQKKPIRPGGGTTGARVAFIRTSGSVFTMPRQFGPSNRIPAALATDTMCRWAAAPSAPLPVTVVVGEAGRHHHQAVHALDPAGLDHLGDRRGRHGHDGEIDRIGNVGHGRVGPHPLDRPGVRVDREDRTAEVAAQQVHQHGMPELGGLVGRADHRDRPR